MKNAMRHSSPTSLGQVVAGSGAALCNTRKSQPLLMVSSLQTSLTLQKCSEYQIPNVFRDELHKRVFKLRKRADWYGSSRSRTGRILSRLLLQVARRSGRNLLREAEVPHRHGEIARQKTVAGHLKQLVHLRSSNFVLGSSFKRL